MWGSVPLRVLLAPVPHRSPARLEILRATRDDLALARVAVVEVHGRSPCDDAAIAEFIADPSRWLILAVQGGRVIGSLNGHVLRHPHRREPQFLLYEIDVRPEARRRGVGTALVRAFVEGAAEAGAFEVWIPTNESNAAAMALYSRCGMRRKNRDDVLWSLDPGGVRSRKSSRARRGPRA